MWYYMWQMVTAHWVCAGISKIEYQKIAADSVTKWYGLRVDYKQITTATDVSSDLATLFGLHGC